MDMVDTVESGLKTHFATKPLLPCQLIRDREVQMNDGKKITWTCFSFNFNTFVSFVYRCQLLVLCRQRSTLHALRRNLLAIGIGRQAIQHVTRTCHANPQGAMFQCPANARAIGLHRV